MGVGGGVRETTVEGGCAVREEDAEAQHQGYHQNGHQIGQIQEAEEWQIEPTKEEEAEKEEVFLGQRLELIFQRLFFGKRLFVGKLLFGLVERIVFVILKKLLFIFQLKGD